MCNNKNKQGFKMSEEIQAWTIPFGMFIQEITNLDDVEEADWEEETE